MKKVQILLSTYNGSNYISEQIDSILKQSDSLIKILIRDDGSTDKTVEIIKQIMNSNKNIELIEGKNVGVKLSFLELIKYSDNDCFLAFSDQDDYWKKDKISSALSFFSNQDIPELYLSKTMMTDDNLNPIEVDSYTSHALTFGELLVKNNGVGCTMVFNQNLKEKVLVCNYQNCENKPLHDHWIYLVCRLFDGNVYYDKIPHILYRQHNNNVVGGQDNFINRVKNNGITNKENVRSKIANELYRHYYEHIDNEKMNLLYVINRYKTNFSAKMRLVRNKEIRTDSILQNLVLKYLIVTNKF